MPKLKRIVTHKLQESITSSINTQLESFKKDELDLSSVFEIQRKNTQIAYRLAIGGLIGIIALSIAIFIMMPLKENTPYFIDFANSDKHFSVVQRADTKVDYGEAFLRNLVGSYITARETINHYASFAWKMHRLINENKLKENHLSADNANKIKQFFFNNGFILGWTKEEQSAIQENRDYSLRSDLLSLEEIAQAKIELQKYYESVYVNGDGNQREIKPFKEILRDINNFEKAYKERYDKLVSLNAAIIQA